MDGVWVRLVLSLSPSILTISPAVNWKPVDLGNQMAVDTPSRGGGMSVRGWLNWADAAGGEGGVMAGERGRVQDGRVFVCALSISFSFGGRPDPRGARHRGDAVPHAERVSVEKRLGASGRARARALPPSFFSPARTWRERDLLSPSCPTLITPTHSLSYQAPRPRPAGRPGQGGTGAWCVLAGRNVCVCVCVRGKTRQWGRSKARDVPSPLFHSEDPIGPFDGPSFVSNPPPFPPHPEPWPPPRSWPVASATAGPSPTTVAACGRSRRRTGASCPSTPRRRPRRPRPKR